MNSIKQIGFTHFFNDRFPHHFTRFGLNLCSNRGIIQTEQAAKALCTYFFFVKNGFSQATIIPVFALFDGSCPEDKKIVGYAVAFDDDTFPTMDPEYNNWMLVTRSTPINFEPFYIVEEQIKSISNKNARIIPILVNK